MSTPCTRVSKKMEEPTLRLPYKNDEHIFVLKDAYLAFFCGQEIVSRYWWKRVWNPIVSWFVGGYTHSEITFRFASLATFDNRPLEIYLACNIYTGEQLQFEFKTQQYKSEIWELKMLNLTRAQLFELYNICKADVQRGIAFNSQVYRNFLCPRFCAYDGQVAKSAWCSEHNASVLQRLGLAGFADIEPYRTDPQQLYQHMFDNHHQLGLSVPPGGYDEYTKKKPKFKLVLRST